MLKTSFEQIEKVLKGTLNKSGLEKKLKKHSNYFAKSKEIWAMINEDLGISDIVENKLISPIGKFERALLVKFPELTKDDVIEIIQSIVGKINAGKDAVLSKVDALKQLQDFNTKLQDENAKLKNQLSKFQSVDTENTATASTETSTTTTIDVKQENIQA